MNVVITGVNGFVGNHLFHEFTKIPSCFVIGLYHNLPPKNISSKNSVLYSADLTQHVPPIDIPIDCVIHVAGIVPGNERDDNATHLNVRMAEVISDWAIHKKISKIIYFSSMSVYGTPEVAVVDENIIPTNPSPYGISKKIGENCFKEISEYIPCVALRPTGIIGKGARGTWISKVTDSMLSGNDIKAYNLYKLFNSVVHVDDISDLCLMLMTRRFIGFSAINLSASNPLVMMDVLKFLKKKLSSQSRIIDGGERSPCFVISTEKALNEFSFKPLDTRMTLERYVKERISN